jgi:transposase
MGAEPDGSAPFLAPGMAPIAPRNFPECPYIAFYLRIYDIIHLSDGEAAPMPDPQFRECKQDQLMLLPPDISELVPENSLARITDMVVRSMDRSTLTALYPGGGTPAHDPQMMLKVILLAYASGIYSSRKIAQATRENIGFMWICGMQPLDHSAINRFRSERIRPVFEEVFSEFVSLLADMGFITLGTYFLDGTKIEANANRFSFVWAKSNRRYQEQLRAKVHAHLKAIDEMEEEEEALAPADPGEIDSAAIAEAARKIGERIGRKGVGRRPKDEEGRALRLAERMCSGEWAEKMELYERNAEILDGRGSFSKTDHDATFMRMKDDHMGNGQLKAAYNIQAGTEGQFIIDTTAHRRPGDTACTIEHLEHAERTIGWLPGEIVADAGYGSEQNYRWLDGKGLTAYVKHGEFFREMRNRKWREDPMRPANWEYDEILDTYACPEGSTLRFVRLQHPRSDLGHCADVRVYRCESCTGCPLKERCFRSEDPDAPRVLRVNPDLARFRKRASFLLNTERGTVLRKQRSVDVETIFGDIKRNWHFTRFLLRGLEKADHEFRLVAAGHNLRKLALSLAG